MLTQIANVDSRLSFWLRVREYAVPPSMIEAATARRASGDWAGACTAAGFDVDLDLRSLARGHGRELAARIRADLRQLVPDLLRWHMPRIAPDGLLRPGLTVTLARYGAAGDGAAEDGAVSLQLVARTPPAWADAGQRISLALWDGTRSGAGDRGAFHPHPRPGPRFRFDLHRHLGAAIRSAVSGSGAGDDYSYGRPSRRSAGMRGVVLPGLRRRPPRVTVVIDTSGSVSDAELGSALLEVTAISRAVGGRRDLVTVLSCDAAARIAHPLCQAAGIPLLGGGGTDLRTGFAKALRAQHRPDVIVVLTDGQTPWPSEQPPCRTVVGLFPRQPGGGSWRENDPDHRPDSPPRWARVVEIGSATADR